MFSSASLERLVDWEEVVRLRSAPRMFAAEAFKNFLIELFTEYGIALIVRGQWAWGKWARSQRQAAALLRWAKPGNKVSALRV